MNPAQGLDCRIPAIGPLLRDSMTIAHAAWHSSALGADG